MSASRSGCTCPCADGRGGRKGRRQARLALHCGQRIVEKHGLIRPPMRRRSSIPCGLSGICRACGTSQPRRRSPRQARPLCRPLRVDATFARHGFFDSALPGALDFPRSIRPLEILRSRPGYSPVLSAMGYSVPWTNFRVLGACPDAWMLCRHARLHAKPPRTGRAAGRVCGRKTRCAQLYSVAAGHPYARTHRRRPPPARQSYRIARRPTCTAVRPCGQGNRAEVWPAWDSMRAP